MTSRRLAAAFAATSLVWTACMHVPGSQLVNRSDPIYGRWQLNLVKSRLAPAPAWRSEALLIARDGDWQVRTTEFVYRDSIAKFPVRCKEDGRDYRAASGRTHALTRLEDRRWKETERLNGVTVAEYDQVLSPDGRQLTVFHTSFDRTGKLLGTRVEVFDKIR